MKTKTTEQFIEEAKCIHRNESDEPLYNYYEVIYLNSHTHILIFCISCNDYFKQTPSKHLSGQGCPKCGKLKNTNKRTKPCDQFITEAKIIHKNKNNEPLYCYSDVEYMNSQTKVDIICQIIGHGSFTQTPANHLRGRGCPKCKGNKISKYLVDTKDTFIEKAILIHKNEYNEPLYCYSKVEYINAQTKVDIICIIAGHGSFTQTPNSHLSQRSGCPICKGNKISITKRMTLCEFIERSKNIHTNTDGQPLYNYSKVNYINNHTGVIIICPIHGDFNKNPNNHLMGSGCQKCTKTNYSRKCIHYLNFMSKYYNIIINHAENVGEFNFSGKEKADGFCPETNTIYEFHGDYWHGNPLRFNPNDINPTTKTTFGELHKKTLEREQRIQDAGFNLLVMWESEWGKINKLIRTIQISFRNKH